MAGRRCSACHHLNKKMRAMMRFIDRVLIYSRRLLNVLSYSSDIQTVNQQTEPMMQINSR